MTLQEGVNACKREMIAAAIVESKGNRTVAAEQLGLTRPYLSRLVRELGVPAPAPKFGNASWRSAP